MNSSEVSVSGQVGVEWEYTAIAALALFVLSEVLPFIKKTKGITKINDSFQKDAIDLILWRESIAQQKNKPRKWIMPDDDLIDYACGKKSLSLKSKKLDEDVADTS